MVISVIASSVDGQVSAIVADFPECDFLAYIPNYELQFETAVVSCLRNCPIRKLLQLVLSPMWRLRPWLAGRHGDKARAYRGEISSTSAIVRTW